MRRSSAWFAGLAITLAMLSAGCSQDEAASNGKPEPPAKTSQPAAETDTQREAGQQETAQPPQAGESPVDAAAANNSETKPQPPAVNSPTLDSATAWLLPYLGEGAIDVHLVDLRRLKPLAKYAEVFPYVSSFRWPEQFLNEVELYAEVSTWPAASERDYPMSFSLVRCVGEPSPKLIEAIRNQSWYGVSPSVQGRDVVFGGEEAMKLALARSGDGALADLLRNVGEHAVVVARVCEGRNQKQLEEDRQRSLAASEKNPESALDWNEWAKEEELQLARKAELYLFDLEPEIALQVTWQFSDGKYSLPLGEAFDANVLAESSPDDFRGGAAIKPFLNNMLQQMHADADVKITAQKLEFTGKFSGDVTGQTVARLQQLFDDQLMFDKRTSPLKNAAIELLWYAHKHDETLPQNIYSADGKPLLSWRVELLPFLGYEEIYKQLKLDEPWDSAHNAALLKQVDPRLFACNPKTPDGHADVLAIVEPDTRGFLKREGDAISPSIASFTDGMSYTAVAVEASPERSVPWAKPEDFAWNPTEPTAGLGREGENFFVAAFGDTRVWKVSKDELADTLRSMFHRHDGKPWELKPLPKLP